MTLVEEKTGSINLDTQETKIVVVGRELIAERVLKLTFETSDGEEFPPWAPGAHIDLILGNGMERQYSLCSDPADRTRLQVGVLLEPKGKGGSIFIHESLDIGSELTMSGPRNHFKLVKADRYVFIAGGIGVTPMMPMIKQVIADGKEWSLYYAGRSAAGMAFQKELGEHGEKVSYFAADNGQRLNLDSILSNPGSERHVVYCCGPTKLSDAAEKLCESKWPRGTFHVERFVPIEIDESTNKPFMLRLDRSGITLEVPADKTTMKAMEDVGVKVPASCAAGTCGTCEVDVLEGEVEHRDSILSADERAENFCMMVCVSRAKSDLIVLDI